VLPQPAFELSAFWKQHDMMCSDRLVVIGDPLTFEVMDQHKYFQSFTKFIGPVIAVDSFFITQSCGVGEGKHR